MSGIIQLFDPDGCPATAARCLPEPCAPRWRARGRAFYRSTRFVKDGDVAGNSACASNNPKLGVALCASTEAAGRLNNATRTVQTLGFPTWSYFTNYMEERS